MLLCRPSDDMAKKAGNYGWPYFVGKNFAYAKYNFAEEKSEALRDAAKPINQSINNTGKEELPSAVTLGGVQMNISGVIGPALGGLLLPLIGANAVFALNAAGFLLILGVILRWRKTRKRSRTPTESMLESFVGALRYVRYTRGIQIVLVRAFLFALLISVIPALAE